MVCIFPFLHRHQFSQVIGRARDQVAQCFHPVTDYPSLNLGMLQSKTMNEIMYPATLCTYSNLGTGAPLTCHAVSVQVQSTVDKLYSAEHTETRMLAEGALLSVLTAVPNTPRFDAQT